VTREALTLDEVLDEFRLRRIEASKNGSETTGDRYVYEVKKWADWLSEERDKTVWQADYYDLTAHLRHMRREDYAVTTRNTRCSAISKFYQELQKLDGHPDFPLPVEEVPENPYDQFDSEDRRKFLTGDTKKSQGIESAEEIYYLSPEEIEQLVENVPAPRLRNQLIVRLLFDTGLRRGELAQVKLSHLDRDDHSIYVPAFKSSEARTVTITPSYVDRLLDEWLDGGYRDSTYFARHEDSEYLFPTNESEHLSGYSINTIVKQSADEAGLQKVVARGSDGRKIRRVNAHTLRHSHAVQAIKSGIDVRRLQASLGHGSLDVTLEYLKLVESDYVDASRQFDPFG
jgi:integrase/recombinase XerD